MSACPTAQRAGPASGLSRGSGELLRLVPPHGCLSSSWPRRGPRWVQSVGLRFKGRPWPSASAVNLQPRKDPVFGGGGGAGWEFFHGWPHRFNNVLESLRDIEHFIHVGTAGQDAEPAHGDSMCKHLQTGASPGPQPDQAISSLAGTPASLGDSQTPLSGFKKQGGQLGEEEG